jgi:hypothetical protein
MIGFCHLPKTGGTSLVQGMRNAGMNVWVPTPPEGIEPWEVWEWDQSPPEGTDVVAGHIAATEFDQFPDVTEWVTVVRHPVVRWVSHLYWINRNRTGNWNLPPSNLMGRMYTQGQPNVWKRLELPFVELWHHSNIDQAADWFGIQLPADRHKATMRPDPIPPDLYAAAVAVNDYDMELWRWINRD